MKKKNEKPEIRKYRFSRKTAQPKAKWPDCCRTVNENGECAGFVYPDDSRKFDRFLEKLMTDVRTLVASGDLNLFSAHIGESEDGADVWDRERLVTLLRACGWCSACAETFVVAMGSEENENGRPAHIMVTRDADIETCAYADAFMKRTGRK